MKQVDVPICANCEGRKNNSVFCKLSRDELDTLSDDRVDSFYKKGEVIFSEGNRGHGVYCIYQGKVKVHKDREDAKEQIVRLARAGDILGYRSLLCDEPYKATATAMEDSVICFIRKSKFHGVLDNNLLMAHKIIKLLANDLRDSERKMVNLAHKPVLERIAEALLVLKDRFGLKADNKTLNINITRREIGDLAGTSTETTIRTLAELNKTEAVRLNGRQIELTDLNKLAELANLPD